MNLGPRPRDELLPEALRGRVIGLVPTLVLLGVRVRGHAARREI